MDAEEREPAGGLTPEEVLRLEAARRAGFRALMLVLDRLRPGAASALGGSAQAHEETIRLRQDPSLVFSLADVVEVKDLEIPAEAGTSGLPRTAVELTATFFGLGGAVSPLPEHMAEEIAQEEGPAGEGPRIAAFLDLFNHRALSFFYRAAAKHDLAAGARSDQGDDWSRRLLALLGKDEPLRPGPGAAATPAPAPAEPRWRALRYAPLLNERAITAAAVEACVTDLLGAGLVAAGPGARVEVEQFAGSWVDLAPDERTRLGASASELGRSLVVGARVFDRAGRFRVVVGPLDAEGYARYSAPERLRDLRRAVTALAGEDLDFDLVLRLAPGAAPGFALSSGGAWRLGRNIWLGRQGWETRVTVDADGAVPAAA